MTAYYNEIDPYCAEWLRNLISANLIAPGEVDTRDIRDVRPADLSGFTQCHFFAGIGGWSYALRLAAWPDHRPVWTGSCPCQPFSQAGARRGFADERHLWPYWHWLIAQHRPAIVFGEQVASKDGRLWFAGVRADLETLGHACGCADLCAAGAAAPHLRQRLYWVANTNGRDACSTWQQRSRKQRQQSENYFDIERMGDAESQSLRGCGQPWEPATPIRCDDGWRRIGPTPLALAHGIPGRVGRLRAYGNAIVPKVAAEFIAAWMDCRP